jgi:hypothetical protein
LRTLRLGLRAWRDFYDQIWWMLLYLAVWWLLIATVIFGPAATLLLFHIADPRLGVWADRPTMRESARYLLDNLGRSWKICLATVPLVVLCAFNLSFYGESDNAIALLTPIWLALLALAVICTITIFAYGGVMESPAGVSIKLGAKVAAARLPQLLLLLLITLLIPYMVITPIVNYAFPLFIVLPGVTAIAVSRHVLDTLALEYPRPNDPTEERLHEKQS